MRDKASEESVTPKAKKRKIEDTAKNQDDLELALAALENNEVCFYLKFFSLKFFFRLRKKLYENLQRFLTKMVIFLQGSCIPFKRRKRMVRVRWRNAR